MRNRIPRILVLTFALLWLAHLSSSVFFAQRINDDVRAIEARLMKVDHERAAASIIIESRLVRIETQLQQLNDTTGKAVWGAIGTMALVVVNALLGLVVRKPKE